MTDSRPNPDALLAQVQQAETKAQRGRLKVFFGYIAGVGKTYAMLEEARKRAAEGMDVLVGYAEPHIRPDTEALLLGLDILPYRLVPYRGATLKEFDLDAALARRPSLILIDELAHTNAPGLRHAKRFQDVQELLDAGISVFTTLNVQHLESVNDIVERISGIQVRETLPDALVEQADEIQLIDLAPEELLERLKGGKVYKAQQAELATKHFFNRGNLMALRELALRTTAQRVDAQMRDFRRDHAITTPWAASERVLVAVGPSPYAAQLVRAAKRLAAAYQAPWVAVNIETPSAATLGAESRQRIAQTLQLAEQLGAQTLTLSGAVIQQEILAYARAHNITKIVIGKPRPTAHHRLRELLRPSFVDALIRDSGQIDIYVIRPEPPATAAPAAVAAPRRRDYRGYGWAVATTAAATFLGALVHHRLGLSNSHALMLNLLGVLLIAMRFGRGPAVFAAVLGVAGFDYTVVPPYFSFAVSDTQYVFVFAVMLVAGVLIATLTHRLRQQTVSLRQREHRTAALLNLSRDLAATREKAPLARTALRHIADTFRVPAAIFLPDAETHLALFATSAETLAPDDKERSVAQWAFEHDERAGLGTSTLPAARGLCLPLLASRGTVGVLAVYPVAPEPAGTLTLPVIAPEQFHLLEAFANQTALALERATLAEEATQAWERVEAEFLRNTLLSGVSHDLRTPLTAIIGTASSLADPASGLSPDARHQLTETLLTEAQRMERLINNLLDMTRLESHGFHLKKDWHPLSEIVGSALHALAKPLAAHPVRFHMPPDLPLVQVDGAAFEQVLINLLDNAAAYTPVGTTIDLSAQRGEQSLIVEVADRGPGLPGGDPEQLFQKFARGPTAPPMPGRRGMGLGLSICRGIVELHGGTIAAKNRLPAEGGGALFRITLPQPVAPPPVDSTG